MRDILTTSNLGEEWREEDIARVQLRLHIILSEQSRLELPDTLPVEVTTYLQKLPGRSNWNYRKMMTHIDANIALTHGRTTGIWGNEELW